MNTSPEMTKHIHHGRNIRRFREMLGIKQEGLAFQLGEEWSQKRVSLLEQKEIVEQDILDQVAKILKVPADAIRNFSEEAAINIIASTLNDNAGSINNNCTINFNPIEKWVEALDENKKLYERLLKSEQEKVFLLQQILESKT
ncbi:helix-turn-helix domain-containing protein [Dyadobacter chenwenxiniae]|uniref:Helix-turn-helix domain-containing protein n=1 Tax=Dyadobacter chenwenxiniae TaxID=2906456 RepID=A0A9X1THS4_9BACT|nr:helix-turn-helix transcriptional regulator [Dyadobacter chenwenxiniae]MCF0065095.1 helix-turn-helix domain-containing protein [Dyadobacter chenwenxiniae]UON84633.1 helix-turn-helix domain-containing protein [Dyadobacter chenwenxiniae]